MRWRLILEEFGLELQYKKGENNVISDALPCLEISDNQDNLNFFRLYGNDDNDLTDSADPIRYHNIGKAQKTDYIINRNLVSHKDYTLDIFCWDNQNHRLISQNRKICLPAALQNTTVEWYEWSSPRKEKNIKSPTGEILVPRERTIKVNHNRGKQGGIPEKEYPGIANPKGDPNKCQTELVPRRPRQNSKLISNGSNLKALAKAKMNPLKRISFEFQAQVSSKRAPKGKNILGA